MREGRFTFISDPSHGWLRVTAADLAVVALSPSDFTKYSYREDNMFYLEEDCDATKFILAWEAVTGKRMELCELHTSKPAYVRTLSPIT